MQVSVSVSEENAEQEPAAQQVSAFLERRREQIAQRWADAALFRTVFTVSRDEAVEAGRAVAAALAAVAASGRVDDIRAAGFEAVRDQLGRMAASRARTGADQDGIADEVAALREPVTELLRAEYPDPYAPEAQEPLLALTVLMGTLRLVVLETTVSAGEEVIARQREQLHEVATPVIKLWDSTVAVPLIGTLDSARSQVVMESLLDAIVAERAR
ncbi:RsbRD N-terminal domain-containing protein, partial [Streptomyces sp. NPDC006129]